MIPTDEIYNWLQEVKDPEVPVLSIVDMGIVRAVAVEETAEGLPKVTITITPTYSGCPAMDVIRMNIHMVLRSHEVAHIAIDTQLAPAWTTEWMSEAGKQKLKEYGIAPPLRKPSEKLGLFDQDAVPCPRCGSNDTELVSQYGATACKALYKCGHCKEPFEHFKCH
jgi:ring-1,2-phenylacetyl-CoA epoxidase subunit PaaD